MYTQTTARYIRRGNRIIMMNRDRKPNDISLGKWLGINAYG